MNILVSWSSGKDSAWMLHVLRHQYPGAVGALLTTMNGEADRVTMHGVRRALVDAQARAAGLPLWRVELPFPCSNAEYEAALARTVAEAARAGFTHVAFGDLFLEDVRQYRERQLADTPLAPLFPLWGLATDRLARDMVAAGVRATLVCSIPGSRGASSTCACSRSCRTRSTRAASAASFTPSPGRGRCSRGRSPFGPATWSSGTASCSSI